MKNQIVSISMGALGLLVASTMPVAAAGWPDTPLGRAGMLVAIQEMEIMLLTHPSATRALEAWCALHHMADPPVVMARKVVRSGPDIVPERVRAELAVSATQPVRHRQVRLVCGPHVLSVADNWYVPDRLTAAMNAALEQTDVPFGRVVAPLDFSRQRLEFTRLWSPWPGSAAASPAGAMIVPPAEIVRQRAVLRDAHDRPFSEVVETYTNQMLDFPPPPEVAR
ncbi:hypothetical protein [Komagataeibacter kakiaceti]